MKKMWTLLLVAVAALTLSACNSSEFQVDGEFLAYEVAVSHDAPQVTWVTVTVEKGEIVSYDIDVRQGTRTQTAGAETTEDTSDDTYSFSWKDKTKKELGDDYGMADVTGNLEWYEQAELLEAYWLDNGVDIAEVDSEGNIDVVTGVSISVDAYYNCALEAIENAKAGKFTALAFSADDLYSATMTVSKKGEVSDLLLDVLQGKPVNETFAWSDKTKQELGDDYGMADVTGGLEWYEQAAVITNYVLAEGWSDSLSAGTDGVGGAFDGTDIDALASATIHTGTYYVVLGALFSYAGDSVK